MIGSLYSLLARVSNWLKGVLGFPGGGPLFPNGLSIQNIVTSGYLRPAAVDDFDINDPNPFGWDVSSYVLPQHNQQQSKLSSLPMEYLPAQEFYATEPPLGYEQYVQPVKTQFEIEMALDDDEDEELFNFIDEFALDDEFALSSSHSTIFTDNNNFTSPDLDESTSSSIFNTSPENSIVEMPILLPVVMPMVAAVPELPSSAKRHIEEEATLQLKNKPKQKKKKVRRDTDEVYRCPDPNCDSTFKVKAYLTRHKKKHTASARFKCPFYSSSGTCRSNIVRAGTKCHATGGFSRKDTFRVHLKALHFVYPPRTQTSMRNASGGRCAGCGKFFENNTVWLDTHIFQNECSGAFQREDGEEVVDADEE